MMTEIGKLWCKIPPHERLKLWEMFDFALTHDFNKIENVEQFKAVRTNITNYVNSDLASYEIKQWYEYSKKHVSEHTPWDVLLH